MDKMHEDTCFSEEEDVQMENQHMKVCDTIVHRGASLTTQLSEYIL